MELAATVFSLKRNDAYGWIVIPVKAGYRYTFNQTGSGFYIEPQLGYNVHGVDPADKVFTGLVYGAGTGYLFKPMGKIQFDLGIRYESAVHKDGAANYLSLRLSHNFSIGRRESEE